MTSIIRTLIVATAATLSLSATAQLRVAESTVGLGYSQTSVNTAIFRASSVVTVDSADVSLQFVGYYSPEGKIVIARRRAGEDKWTSHTTDYRAKVEDGHNVISLAADGDGYLHVCYDHHGSPLHYRTSVAPYSTVLGEEKSMTGEEEQTVTYPEFHMLPSGNLAFLYRTGSSGSGDMLMNVYDKNSRKWSRVCRNLIDGEGKRNAYWQMTIDQRGRIHLSWVWRETWNVETNHDLCYAYSDDEGRTWHKSDGTQYTLPITLATAEVAWAIPQNSELINQTSMAADRKGHPYIATYWREADSQTPQYRLVWHNGRKWQMCQVSDRKTSFSLAGGGTKMIPIARPRFVIGHRDSYFIFRDAECDSRVSVFYSRKLGVRQFKWRQLDLTEYSVGAWEPSIDETLWTNSEELDIFVQETFQGDGEKVVSHEPTPVKVLSVRRRE